MTNTYTDDSTFTATLTITSTGFDQMVNINYDMSHDLSNRLENGEPMPAAYSLMRDIGLVLNMMQMSRSLNHTDEELAAKPEAEQMELILDAASEASSTVKTTRLS